MNGLKQAGRMVTVSWKRTVIAAAIAIGVWTVFVLLYFPEYSAQMISRNIFLLDDAVASLLWYQYASDGVLGVLIPPVIAVLTGITVVITAVSLLQRASVGQSVGGTVGTTVGVLGAGCTSCSAGALALLGFAGGVALLPFNGRGLQVASIGLLLLSLEYAGRNTTCRIDSGEIL